MNKRISSSAFRAARNILIQAAVSMALACPAVTCCAQVRPSTAPVSFFKEVFPIFRTACAGCHNGEVMAGGLNLTSYAAAVKGGRGGALFVPSKGADSRIIKFVTGALKPQMPPGGGLKQADIDRLRQWIDAGAKVDAMPADNRPAATAKTTGTGTRTVSIKPGAAFVLKRAAPVTSLAFGPDGKTLAVGTYREVQFWNLETKALTARWTGHSDTVRGLAYSKDGHFLAAGGGASGALGEVRLWDVAAGKELRVFGDHTDAVNGVAFNPAGTRIATASADKTIKTWETATGKLIATGKDHSDAVWGIAWSPDGKYLASCGADRSVKIWDAAAMKRLYSLGGHEDVVYSVEFSTDGKTVITASADRTVRVWNIGPEGGTTAQTLAGNDHNVLSASFAPGGGAATASGDKTVKLWDAGGGNTRTLTGAKDWIYAVRFSKDGKTVAGGTWDGAVLVWTATNGKLKAQFSTGPQH
jgi:WD40 repeat protein